MRAAVEAMARMDARLGALAGRRRAWVALFLAALGLLLALYAPALAGAFVSDDWGFVVNNPWVRNPTRAHLLAILHPWSEATEYAANWAPVHLLAHVLEWRLFGEDVRGYHVTNLVLHALVSVQLVALYRRSGLAPLAALFGGAIFLLHPSNVEAVAWISEVKTLLAMTLALGALELQQRRPALAVLLFGLALLAKALAVFALPVAIMRAWCGPAPGADPARDGARSGWWLLAWLAVFALYAPPQWAAFQRIGESDLGLHPDAWVSARTIVAFVARYLVMAATGTGLSAFHDPPRALSAADPWWLAGALALAVFAARALRCFLRRDEEAVYWAWAIGGWIPIAQFFPFTYPLGDRYLYFPLPGLVGVALLLLQRGQARLRARAPATDGGGRLAAAAFAGGLVLLGSFAARVPARAAIWRSEPLLMVDAARHYPDGIQAHLVRAFRAGEQRDAETAAGALRAARDRGFDQFMALEQVPAFGPILREPAFRAARAEIAGLWLERFAARRQVANQGELRVAALAHEARGERAEAIAALEEALQMDGPYRQTVAGELAALRGRPAP